MKINRSRIRGPYVRFCERDEVSVIDSPHPTRLVNDNSPWQEISHR